MSIPEEDITKHLDMLLAKSSPGDDLGALHVVAVPADATSPLGALDPSKSKTTVAVLACNDETVSPQDFAVHAIARFALDHTKRGEIPVFAALKQEIWTVEPLDDQVTALIKAGKSISEHPRAAEITVVYAAARDGRRWLGRHWLTGPHAGTTEGPQVLTGPADPREGLGFMSCAIRKLVGQPIGD